jgi:phosphoserine phosphatase
MDSTLIQTEVIDEADLAGVESKGKPLQKAMNGEIDFKESFKAHGFVRRFAKKYQVSLKIYHYKRSASFDESLKYYGYKTAILSEGLPSW